MDAKADRDPPSGAEAVSYDLVGFSAVLVEDENGMTKLPRLRSEVRGIADKPQIPPLRSG